MPNIFISYVKQDESHADTLNEMLSQPSIRVVKVPIERTNYKSIVELLKDSPENHGNYISDMIVVLFSKNYSSSKIAMSALRRIKLLADVNSEKNIRIVKLDDQPLPLDFEKYRNIRIEKGNLSTPNKLSESEEIFYKSDDNDEYLKRQTENLNSKITQLRQSLDDGKLTLVCGAGISINANIPPWTKLLDRLLDAMVLKLVDDPADVNLARVELDAIRDASSLIVGRYLKNVLGDDFISQVRDSLYDGSKDTCDTIEAIVKIARPKRAKPPLESIINFNFDDLIEQNLELASVRFKAIFTEGMRHNPEEIPIYHVHGFLPRKQKITDKMSIVFSEDAYHDQFIDPFSWSNLTQLNKFSQNTCLFIGLSMTDPNLRRLLDVANRKDGTGSNRHCVILKREESSSKTRLLESLREQDAASLGLSILWIDSYSDLPNILKRLT